jgi:hypothetical protein
VKARPRYVVQESGGALGTAGRPRHVART